MIENYLSIYGALEQMRIGDAQNIPKENKYTYCKRSSAGPPFNTSLTAIDGSPVAKCGLSLPPTKIKIQLK